MRKIFIRKREEKRKDKFTFTREKNVSMARRKIIDYIWQSANLEGIQITFVKTQNLFYGIGVEGVKVDDIIKINNLKRAWQFLLETLDRLTDFDYLCRLNMIIGSEGSIYGAGKIRASDVRVSGTNWQPQIPFEYDVRNEISDILKLECVTESAITLMLWSMRRQVFIDGNKRTAMMIANKEMIANGCGIISVPNEYIKSFYSLLIEFYETNNIEKIKNFVYENCIDGLEF